jgi:hypothetical protein
MFSTLRVARERYGMTALSPTKDSAGTADDFGTDTNSAPGTTPRLGGC